MKKTLFPFIFVGLVLAFPLNADTIISNPNKVEVVNPTTVAPNGHKDVPVVPHKDVVVPKLLAGYDAVAVPNKDGTVVPHKDVPVVPDTKGHTLVAAVVIVPEKDAAADVKVVVPNKEGVQVKDHVVAHGDANGC